MPESTGVETEGFNLWETLDDSMSVLENMETMDSELPFGLSSKFSSFFEEKYKDISGKVVEKYEDIKHDVKAWKEREIKAPTWEGSKKAFKKEARFAMDVVTLGTRLTWNIVKGLFKFAKLMIDKKGNVGFKEGWDIGGEMFTLEDKKKGK